MIKVNRSTADIMTAVLLATLPAAHFSVWMYGPGVLLNLLLCCATALACEAGISLLRNRHYAITFPDRSALLAAVLLALCLPPLLPLWLPVVGTAFAIVVGKQLYGGLGQNPFNPAMVGYAALLIAFPREMSLWPDAAQSLGFTPLLQGYNALPWDAISGATVLDGITIAIRADQAIPSIALWQQPASFVAVGWLCGGLWLLYRGIINWQIPLGLIAALLVLSTVFHLGDAARYASPLTHLLAGATMMAAFFIATDPVSAPAHWQARFLYGAGIGLLIYVIRAWGSFPDGAAFAVLLMNLVAPTLDHLWRGRR